MYKIAVIGGDGTGPEVTREAVKVLEAIQKKFSISFQFTPLDYNGTRHMATGQILSDAELEGLRKFDAILLGAIGHPDVKPGILERGILLKIRFGLDQYINLRPVQLYENVETPLKNKGPKDINYIVVRENSGDLYIGKGHTDNQGQTSEVAVEEMVYTYTQVKRCLRYAFETAKNRRKGQAWANLSPEDIQKGYTAKLTLVGKSNVLANVFGLWNRVYDELKPLYPTVKTDYIHVDACCIYMVECPERFDVIVTTNMFGDIITDLAAVTQGGMGISPGANINPEGVSMFEPIGGTAPDFTGKNQINPLAAIGSAQMMLTHFNEIEAAEALEVAMKKIIKKTKSMAAAKMGYSTTEIGDMIAKEILNA
jgi:3-isopropylmalate dehydrogenase